MLHYPIVLVTGASRGLGAAIGRELAARGYRIMLAARDGESLETLGNQLRTQHGDRIAWDTLDLRSPESIARIVETTLQRFGQIDALINNAGIGTYKPFLDWSETEIAETIQVNLTAPMLLARRVLPDMIARRHGMIVNIASDLARRYLPQMSPYVASKAGMLGFSGSLLREVKSANVKVTTLLPGIIDTNFNGSRENSRERTWSLDAGQVAKAVADLLELPEHVIFDEVTLHPMQQDF